MKLSYRLIKDQIFATVGTFEKSLKNYWILPDWGQPTQQNIPTSSVPRLFSSIKRSSQLKTFLKRKQNRPIQNVQCETTVPPPLAPPLSQKHNVLIKARWLEIVKMAKCFQSLKRKHMNAVFTQRSLVTHKETTPVLV